MNMYAIFACSKVGFGSGVEYREWVQAIQGGADYMPSCLVNYSNCSLVCPILLEQARIGLAQGWPQVFTSEME